MSFAWFLKFLNVLNRLSTIFYHFYYKIDKKELTNAYLCSEANSRGRFYYIIFCVSKAFLYECKVCGCI